MTRSRQRHDASEWELAARQVDVVPRLERRQRRVAEGALQIAADAGQMAQVLRLAVALVEAGENAEDLRGALGRERRIDHREGGEVEGGIGGPPRPYVTAEQLELELLRHVDA